MAFFVIDFLIIFFHFLKTVCMGKPTVFLNIVFSIFVKKNIFFLALFRDFEKMQFMKKSAKKGSKKWSKTGPKTDTLFALESPLKGVGFGVTFGTSFEQQKVGFLTIFGFLHFSSFSWKTVIFLAKKVTKNGSKNWSPIMGD